MNPYQQSSNIKLGLFIIAIVLSSTIIWINRKMVNQLRQDAQKQVEHLAQSYTNAINSDNDDELQFVLDVMLPSMNFPIIITTRDEIYAIINIDIKIDKNSPQYENHVRQIIARMDEEFQPLKIVWNNMEVGDIHYGDPEIVGKIRWLPYLELCFALLFILLTYWGFQLIRKSEKDSIYVGMARETAHQLGTPISSLMGWFNLLQENDDNKEEIMKSLSEDINRLSNISDRFAKIGSKPQQAKIDIMELLIELVDYLSTRSSVKIHIDSSSSYFINGDWLLLTWAFENIIKNGIDAIGKGDGDIHIHTQIQKGESLIIDIIDSGKGIDRQHKKDVFKPGYSTKKRGWGLGLSLTKRIIEEMHNGNVFVQKSQPRETVFRIILDLK